MKRFKDITKWSLIAVAFLVSSCSDFLNVNKDPNRVTGDNVTPDLIFTQAENAVGRRQATRFVFLNNWMGYWSRSGTFIVDQEETTYKITNPFTETNWDQAYDILFDLYQTKTKALANNDSVLAGAATVLSVKLWQETVDQFGAIPYSQAFNNVSYTSPKYDKAQDIYADLLVQLDNAVKELNAAPTSYFNKTDIIFARGGNVNDAVTMWKKFANTIRLRILIRQSQVTGFNPTTQLAKITSDGFLGVGESVTVNPGYMNATNQQNPFYGAFGLTPAGAPASTNNEPNSYFVNTIVGSNDKASTKDPRLAQWYGVNSSGKVESTDYGAQNGSHTPVATAIVGSGFGPGLLQSSTADQFIFLSFESLFLQAEATARGWLPGGDAAAQTLFNEGIAESFSWLAVPNATTAAATYETTVPSANWANSGTAVADKVKFINFQKYIAMCGIDPVEAWSDLRRGALVLPAGYLSWNSNAATSLPNVLTYPQTEFTTNSSNIPSPTRTTSTIFTEKLFWQP